jgi:hypothetical protein
MQRIFFSNPISLLLLISARSCQLSAVSQSAIPKAEQRKTENPSRKHEKGKSVRAFAIMPLS